MNQPVLLRRSATFDRTRANEADRTVPASLSSEEPVQRYGQTEVLSHEPDAVDLTRAAGGLPLLYAHDPMQPVGVVEQVRLERGRLVGVLRFGQSAKAQEAWQDVLDGVLRGVSVGYVVNEYASTADGVLAVRWTPYEASILAVPADITVGVNRGASPPFTPGATAMPITTQTTPAPAGAAPEILTREAEIGEIRGLAARHGHSLPSGFVEGLIARGATLDSARAAVLEELAQRDIAAGGHLTVRREPRGPASSVSTMEDALVARLQGRSAERDNPYRHARMVDLARECLELRSVRTSYMSPGELVERALHTTSDFPNLLQGAGERVLRQVYGSLSGIKRAFKSSTAIDFRAKQALQLGEAPTLLKVNEAGEFKQGTMAEAKSTYALATYGRIFSLSRQALVNDDLDAFGSMVQRFGRAAAEFESQFLVDLLLSNPTMGEDGVALFHASHGNLATGGSSVLSLDALSTARKGMRLQKGLDKKTPVDAAPKFLIVPAALETTGEQLLAQITAAKTSDVNVFGGKLDLIVDPRLDVVSSTRWFLAADPALIDTIEYSHLDSAGGPEIFTKEGFEIDGMEMKVRLDFGAGVQDFRGLYRADGV